MKYKALFASKTIWGLIITCIARATGSSVDIDDAMLQQVIELASMLLEVGGGLLAVYGRIVAKEPINFNGKET